MAIHRYVTSVCPMLVAVMISLVAASCGSDAWQDLPGPVYDFVIRYFPSSEVADYSRHDGSQTVWIKDGPTLSFDGSDRWTRIDGNGGTLPAMLIYDELPERLYDYLEELEAVDAVYGLARDQEAYYVTLHDSTVEYDIQTGECSYVTTTGAHAKT